MKIKLQALQSCFIIYKQVSKSHAEYTNMVYQHFNSV